jgi:ankyrin repeat protein
MEVTAMKVVYQMILEACKAGDFTHLRRCAQQDIRVSYVDPACYTAVDVARCLVQELEADVNQADEHGNSPLFVAAAEGSLAVVQCLVKELGADVNQAVNNGCSPLCIAAENGFLSLVRCLVKELGADVNQARSDGGTPLIIAAQKKHTDVVVWLSKHGANTQASGQFGTAADLSRSEGAPAEQTAYLKARMHCANSGCGGAGLKKCSGCLKVYFCGPACIWAHWPAHKAECREAAAKLKMAKKK